MRSHTYVIATLLSLATLHIAYTWIHWGSTWDDSAITLAFSRNLAEHGEIVASPGGERVEGYSTPLWMLLHAGLFLVHGQTDLIVPVAKLSSLGFNLINLGLVFAVGRRYLGSVPAALVGATLFGFLSISLIESKNGMENPVFLALYLMAFLTYPNGSGRGSRRWFTAFTLIFLLVRWEALWFLLPFTVADLVRGGPRAALNRTAITWLVVFGLTTLARWLYFGDLVPNTILAKSHPPYSDASFSLVRHLRPLRWFVGCLQRVLAGLVIAAIVASLTWHAAGRLREVCATALDKAIRALRDTDTIVILGLVTCAGVFNVAIGPSWGPGNRMMYLALPLSIILILRFPQFLHQTTVGRVRHLVGTVVLVAIVSTMWAGVRDAVARARTYRVTVEQVRAQARGVDKIRQGSGRDELSFAGPDMGGVLLYGDRLNVTDLALLCNRRLAHAGYEIMPEYLLVDVKPDVVVVHDVWTELSGLHSDERFVSDYAVLFCDGQRFFVRHEVLSIIDPTRLHPGQFETGGGGGAYDPAAYASQHPTDLDRKLNARFGTYWVLDRDLHSGADGIAGRDP